MSKESTQKQMSLWMVLVRILPQVASISPRVFTLNYIFFAFNGVFDVAVVFCMQILFDRVANLTKNKSTFMATVLALLLLFIVKILKEVMSGIANFMGETYDMRTSGKLSHIINLKMAKLDPICFENPEILDDINKAYLGTKHVRTLINTIMDVITSYTPYFLVMGIYLFALKPVLVIILFLVFFPVMFAQMIRIKVFAKLEDDSAPLRRKAEYYENCLTGKEYLKETRILGACPYFMKLFKEALIQMNHLRWKADVKINLIELIMKLISIVGYIGILWMLFSALMKQEITIGAFAAVFASVDNMFNLMEEIICGRLPYCAENFGKIQNYLRFLDLPERIGDEKVEKKLQEKTFHGDIILENVSFSYPLSERNSVENINLTIHSGETIAVVGENGSGKSTLIRLIIGVYLPQKGKVLHNNKSTKEFKPSVLFTGTTGVFQKFQRYQLSLSDNIAISELDYESKIKKDINHAAIQAGIKVDDAIFPNGYDTMLSREFAGVDLSGGQWQKVSIARGFYRSHELIILDEPTAAIDPIEETKIYERFAEIAKNKTAVVVTHRLGSVKFANRIVVMKDGNIMGIGNHDELLSNCPLYADMWKSQAQYYTTTDTLL